MNPSSDLFELIKSLTKAEKRHLKLRASFHGGEKSYLRLFELYEKLEQTDSGSLAQAWEKVGKSRSLPATKKYLYDFILSGLEQFHAHSGSKAEIQTLLKQVDLLFDKSLYDQCAKLLAKARKLAIEYQSPRFLLEIIVWELRITLSPKFRGEISRTPMELMEEERKLLDDLQTINTARGFRFSIEAGHIPDDFDERLSLLNEPSNAVVVCEIERARAAYHLKAGRRSMALHALENERKALESAGALLSDRVMQSKYLNCIAQSIGLYIEEEMLDSARTQLLKLSPISISEQFKFSEHLRLRALAHYHTLQLRLCMKSGKQQELTKATQEAVQIVCNQDTDIHCQFLCPLKYQVSIASHMLGDASMALRILAGISKSEFAQCSADLIMDARWFQVIVHYDKGNLDAVEHLTDAMTRQLKAKKELRPEHAFLLKLFKALRAAVTSTERQMAFSRCLVDLNAAHNLRSDSTFDYAMWCAGYVHQHEKLKVAL